MTSQTGLPNLLQETIDLFLADMEKERFSLHTLRDYSIDLKRFADFYQGPLEGISGNTVSEFFGSLTHLRPSSLARKRAAISSFLKWAYHHQLIKHNPMTNLDNPYPRPGFHPLPNLETVSKIFNVIPPTNLRDRIMFQLIGELGLQAVEILTLQVEDVDLTKHPLHLVQRHIVANNQVPTKVTPSLDSEIRQYLAQSGFHQGPLFRARKKKREEPLRFQSLYEIWKSYCNAADISLSLHDLRLLALSNQQELRQLRMAGGSLEMG